MQDWGNAITYSTYVIDNKAFALSGNQTNQATGYIAFDSMWFYDTGSEIIWQIGFTGTSYGGALGTVFLNFNRDYTYYYPDYVPAEWVLNLYNSKDVRYGAYFPSTSDTGATIGYDYTIPVPLLMKYYGNFNLISSYRLYQVCMPKPLRLAEQYLIRAEAYCMTGQTGLANQDLTTLSHNRDGGSINVGATEESWIDVISDERVKELYMEGFRLNDLKRWNRGFERTPNDYSQTTGKDLKVEAGDPLFVWPIPQHELGGEPVAPDFPLDRQWVAEPEPNETEEMLGITWTKRLFDISSGNTVKLGQMNSLYAIRLPLSNPDTDFVSVDEIVGIAVSGTSGTAGTISGTSDKFEESVTIEYSNLTENSVTITYDGSVYECTAAETVMKFIEM